MVLFTYLAWGHGQRAGSNTERGTYFSDNVFQGALVLRPQFSGGPAIGLLVAQHGGHQPDGPVADAKEEDAVVEAPVIVCDEEIDVGVRLPRWEENLEGDFVVHDEQVCVEPAGRPSAISTLHLRM